MGKSHGEGKFTSTKHMYGHSTKTTKSQPNSMRKTKIESTIKAAKSKQQGEKNSRTTVKKKSKVVKQGSNLAKEQEIKKGGPATIDKEHHHQRSITNLPHYPKFVIM